MVGRDREGVESAPAHVATSPGPPAQGHHGAGVTGAQLILAKGHFGTLLASVTSLEQCQTLRKVRRDEGKGPFTVQKLCGQIGLANKEEPVGQAGSRTGL